MVVSDDANRARARKALLANRALQAGTAAVAVSRPLPVAKPKSATRTRSTSKPRTETSTARATKSKRATAATSRATAATMPASAASTRATSKSSVSKPAGATKPTTTKRVSAARASTPRPKTAAVRPRAKTRAKSTPTASSAEALAATATIVPATPYLGSPQLVPSQVQQLPSPNGHAGLNGHGGLNGHAGVNGYARQPGARSALPRPLWSTRQLTLWGVILFGSIVTCFVAYILCADDATLSSQAPSLNVAMVSLVAAGGANAWILIVGRRAIGMRRRALLGEPAATSLRARQVAAPATASGSDTLVADPGLRRFHRSDCALVAGRGWPSASRTEHERARRLPCGVCRP
jgi:hypothetical protein